MLWMGCPATCLTGNGVLYPHSVCPSLCIIDSPFIWFTYCLRLSCSFHLDKNHDNQKGLLVFQTTDFVVQSANTWTTNSMVWKACIKQHQDKKGNIYIKWTEDLWTIPSYSLLLFTIFFRLRLSCSYGAFWALSLDCILYATASNPI